MFNNHLSKIKTKNIVYSSFFPKNMNTFSPTTTTTTTTTITTINNILTAPQLKNIAHYADIIAIPLFLLLFIYFYNIEHKTPFEYLLFFFSISGLILDIIFTAQFFMNNNLIIETPPSLQ